MTTLDPRALEEAAEAVGRHIHYSRQSHNCHRCRRTAASAITAYLAATQPIVETVEGLEGLAAGAAVVEFGGEVRIKSEKSWFCGCCLEGGFPKEDVNLPARVIWRPHD